MQYDLVVAVHIRWTCTFAYIH